MSMLLRRLPAITLAGLLLGLGACGVSSTPTKQTPAQRQAAEAEQAAKRATEHIVYKGEKLIEFHEDAPMRRIEQVAIRPAASAALRW